MMLFASESVSWSVWDELPVACVWSVCVWSAVTSLTTSLCYWPPVASEHRHTPPATLAYSDRPRVSGMVWYGMV